jgi:hypothetical protein
MLILEALSNACLRLVFPGVTAEDVGHGTKVTFTRRRSCNAIASLDHSSNKASGYEMLYAVWTALRIGSRACQAPIRMKPSYWGRVTDTLITDVSATITAHSTSASITSLVTCSWR